LQLARPRVLIEDRMFIPRCDGVTSLQRLKRADDQYLGYFQWSSTSGHKERC